MPALHRHGTEFMVELAITRNSENDGPIFTGFLRDITERKRIEEQKTNAIRARDELIAVVSHRSLSLLLHLSNRPRSSGQTFFSPLRDLHDKTGSFFFAALDVHFSAEGLNDPLYKDESETPTLCFQRLQSAIKCE